MAKATWKSTCFASGRREPGYDRLETRHFRFVPVLGLPTLKVCAMHREACPRCGTPKVKKLLRADSKHRPTKAFGWFVASWAKRLSWQGAARIFDTPWDTVHRAAVMAVARGRVRISLEVVTALGQRYFTPV